MLDNNKEQEIYDELADAIIRETAAEVKSNLIEVPITEILPENPVSCVSPIKSGRQRTKKRRKGLCQRRIISVIIIVLKNTIKI